MRAQRRLALAVSAALAALTALAALSSATGCGGPASKPAPSADAAFGVTDRAWIEVNIAMDEQLGPLLALVPQRATRPEVKALAVQVRTLADDELSTLRRLHDQARLPAQNPHEGMSMPGMVTATELTQAATLDGTDFDALTVKKVTEYLVQGVSLARSETKYGGEARTRALAANGLATRNGILSTLSG